MKLGRISISTFFRIIVFSLVLVVFFLTIPLPLKGEGDYLTEMGVVKANQMIEAPGFVLPDLDGRTRRLSDFQGKFVILNFWATW